MRSTEQRTAGRRSGRLEHTLAWLAGRGSHHANNAADRIIDATERWAMERSGAHRSRRACLGAGRVMACCVVHLGNATIHIGEFVLRERRR